jgi:hypothetical protein
MTLVEHGEMKTTSLVINRRPQSFTRYASLVTISLVAAGTSFGIGALYSVFPALTRSAGADGIMRTLAELNGEAPAPFSFVQLSDSHVGFNGPPDPLGTQAFESAVATILPLRTLPRKCSQNPKPSTG